jgi:hypothetical protein
LHCKPEYLFQKIELQAEMARALREHGRHTEGAHIVEVGTGWVPILPISFWFCGAARIDTFDLNRHLLPEVLASTLPRFITDIDKLRTIWQDLVPEHELADKLALVARYKADPVAFLEAAGIHYRAPADAGDTGLEDDTVGIHCSTSTFEHIPPEDLLRILVEARRVLAPDGLAVHLVDPKDHFAYYDESIPTINFLGMSDKTYRKHFGNRYTYQNRLHDRDFRALFKEAGLRLVYSSWKTDERSLGLLRDGFPLAKQFADASFEDLSRHQLLYVAAAETG